jgi:FkbM family methyltransferase
MISPHAPRTVVLTGAGKPKTFTFVPATDEQFVLKEVLIDECYAFDFKPTDVVLNLGGHIGAFDVFAYDRVARIKTLEPSARNYAKLRAHLAANRITNVDALNLAVAGHTGYVNLLEGDNTCHNSTGGAGVPVPCVSLRDMLASDQYTKIKCDVEGGEYAAFDGVTLPESVNELWFETHTFSEEARAKHEKLKSDLCAQGFVTREIGNDPLSRTFILHAVRA